MRSNKRGYGLNWTLIIPILLLISLLFGFLFDFICTRIEYAVYPKPDEFSVYVEKYSDEYGLDENLIWAVIKTESDFDPSALSGVGAVGLMQLMPDTFEEITNRRLGDGFDIGMRYDPETNIRYGTYYLSYLYARYGNVDTALAAYNGGLGNVDSWLEDPEYAGGGENSLKYIPLKETREYVKKVNKALEKYNELYK